jgi:hypothetical protein
MYNLCIYIYMYIYARRQPRLFKSAMHARTEVLSQVRRDRRDRRDQTCTAVTIFEHRDHLFCFHRVRLFDRRDHPWTAVTAVGPS